MTRRIYRRLFRLNDRITELDRVIAQVSAELAVHRVIADDARRDAAVGNHIDGEEADLTAADVKRFETALAALEDRRHQLTVQRDLLAMRLSD